MDNVLSEKAMTNPSLKALCVICLLVAFAVPLVAAPPDEENIPGLRAPEAGTAEPVSTKAMRVIYDPDTGKIISVPLQEAGETLSTPVAKALTRSTEGLQVFELENGGGGVHLSGRYQHVLLVRVQPDGTLETVCTSHPHEAESFFKSRTAGAKPAPKDK